MLFLSARTGAYSLVKTREPFAASTCMGFMRSILPESRFLLKSFSNSLCSALFTGRAPNSGSKPAEASRSTALSETFMLTSCCLSKSEMPFNCRRTIWRICSFSNGRNIIISSILLRNSGRIVFFSISITWFRVSEMAFSYSRPLLPASSSKRL